MFSSFWKKLIGRSTSQKKIHVILGSAHTPLPVHKDAEDSDEESLDRVITLVDKHLETGAERRVQLLEEKNRKWEEEEATRIAKKCAALDKLLLSWIKELSKETGECPQITKNCPIHSEPDFQVSRHFRELMEKVNKSHYIEIKQVYTRANYGKRDAKHEIRLLCRSTARTAKDFEPKEDYDDDDGHF